MIKNFKWLLLVSLTFAACNNNDETIVSNSSNGLPLTSGSADFSKFVALGNSLTAGYSDNALFIEGQKVSYANIMAEQFALVGGGAFKIPFMADNIGGFKINGTQAAGPRFYFNGAGPAPVAGIPSTEILNPAVVAAGPYNNCGVPGAKSFHLLSPSYGSAAGLAARTANPYYVRFAPNSTTSVLAYAMSQAPTFFSLWIGNNDVLGYATTGGDGTDPITPLAGPAGVGFDATYNTLVNSMTSVCAKGVVANIPYVNTVPFFTTVPYNPLSSSVLGGGNPGFGVATINALNTQLYGPLKAALSAVGGSGRIELLSTTSANPLLIKDESLTNLSAQLTAAFSPSLGPQVAAVYGAIFGQARQARPTDLVLLTTQAAIGAAPTASDSGLLSPTTGLPIAPTAPLDKFGITFPLQDKHVLVPTEIAELKTATDNYNVTIKSAAAAKGLAFVDANTLMTLIASGGISANGYNVTNTFITGGGFSTDGVHPSPRGYALIANSFIEAINAKYGSNLKGVNLNDYRIMFPSSL